MSQAGLRELCLLVDPTWAAMVVDDEDGRPVSRAEFEEWGDFGTEVAQRAGPGVQFSERAEPASDPDGVMYLRPVLSPGLADIGATSATKPAIPYERTVLLGIADSPREARGLEPLAVAGAIPGGQYQAWRTYREECLPIGLWGLTSVGTTLAARCESSFMATTRYCVLDAEGVLPSFTALVGAYLQAYARLL